MRGPASTPSFTPQDLHRAGTSPALDFYWVLEEPDGVASLSPRGQFYLRPSNKMKFVVPGANVKYNLPWKDEWIVVEGEWGRSVHIGGTEYPVPTQFSPRDKWSSEELSSESKEILTRIQKRGYINMQ
ncbi:hypothetical protein Q3G72_026727 [Acer saccharum]|nr:hypothetical protein Q3G72_026727 [Acer saccharum]